MPRSDAAIKIRAKVRKVRVVPRNGMKKKGDIKVPKRLPTVESAKIVPPLSPASPMFRMDNLRAKGLIEPMRVTGTAKSKAIPRKKAIREMRLSRLPSGLTDLIKVKRAGAANGINPVNRPAKKAMRKRSAGDGNLSASFPPRKYPKER